MDRRERPTSPSSHSEAIARSDVGFRSESSTGFRSAAESYLHFRSHSRAGSQHSHSNSIGSGGGTSSSLASDATPTPSASALRRAQQALMSGHGHGSESDTASRLDFLGSGNISSGTGSKLSSLLHTLQPGSRHGGSSSKDSHSKSDSASGAASPLPGHAKMMPSSSGSSAIRVPYSSSGTLNTYGSTNTLVSASSTPLAMTSALSADKDNPWGALHVHVLPLFNRDPLKIPIEDLNQLVRKHMVGVIARNPSRAVSILENDVGELITAGMVTLNSKLQLGNGATVEDDKLAGRIVDLWGFFWDQVLPYVEGVFLPLQTDPYLLSLVKTPRHVRASSPTSDFGLPSATTSTFSNIPGAHSIDVRKLALRAFRDSVVLPMAPRLQKRFSMPSKERELSSELSEHYKPRLEQMLLVLSSIGTHTISLTSTSNPPTSTPGEWAITTLLRLVLYPPGSTSHTNQLAAAAMAPAGPVTRLPSFISGGAPRDRRGRIARRSMQLKLQRDGDDLTIADDSTIDADGGRRGGIDGDGMSVLSEERERQGRELLNSLKSPNLDLEATTQPRYDDEEDDTAEFVKVTPPKFDGQEGSDDDLNPTDGPGLKSQYGTVVPPNDAFGESMSSLGTGPAGWGAPVSTTNGPTGDVPENARRAAIYGGSRMSFDRDDGIDGGPGDGGSGSDGDEADGEARTYTRHMHGHDHGRSRPAGGMQAGLGVNLAPGGGGSGLSTRRPSRTDAESGREGSAVDRKRRI
ncbi:HbrB-domain-containing protein [Serendipita vermifera]|nr:HbrB-domain-containing protein [Serendipita vermifera]